MEELIGKSVYFARNYRGVAAPNVIVRDVGTFYIDRPAPEGVNVVVGTIMPIRQGTSYSYYNLFMNFNTSELLACTNSQPGQVSRNSIINENDTKNELHFPTVKDAMDAYDKLQREKVQCTLRGNVIVVQYAIDKAKEILNKTEKKGINSIYRRATTKINMSNYNDDDFEI